MTPREERKPIVRRGSLFRIEYEARSRKVERNKLWHEERRDEIDAEQAAYLAPPPLYFSDGRRIDEPRRRRWA